MGWKNRDSPGLVAGVKAMEGTMVWIYPMKLSGCFGVRLAAARVPAPVSGGEEQSAEPRDGRAGIWSDTSPTAAPEPRRLAEYVQNALDALPDPYRMVVVLRDVHGLGLSEIGELLQCSPGTVKSHLRQGRDELRRRLAPFV